MKIFTLIKGGAIAFALMAFGLTGSAQTCTNTINSGGTCAPRSGFFYGELLPNNGCGTFATYSPYGPGQYFRMPVLSGACYSISTCGSSIDTQLSLYQGNNTSTPFMYRDDNGPLCGGTSSSVTFLPGFTDYTRVDVRQYNCLPGGSASITVYVRQNNNLAFTSSNANMCEGQTRTLTATPAPLGSAQPNSGDLGTFSGTGVSGTTFTAPTPAGASGNYAIDYDFGYCSVQQVITVYRNPSTAIAGSNQNICQTSTAMSATAPAFGTGTWTVLSGPGSVSSPNSPTSAVTGLSYVTPTVLQWAVSNGPCVVSMDTVTVTSADSDPPSITCPPLQYATVDSFCNNQLADYTGLASAADLCGSVNVSQLPAPGTTINGTTVVTLTATDEAGNTANCNFTVKLAPTITHFTSRTDTQWRVRWEYPVSTPNDTNFRIRYWEQGFPGAFTDRSQFPSDYQKKITGLDPNTWYKVKIGFACANGDFIWGDTDSVRTKIVSCPTPSGNAQDLPLSLNGASVSWTDQGATSYKFRFRQQGSSTWNYSTLGTTNKTISGGLSPGTNYEYQLKALCTSGLWSSYTAVSTFMTDIPPGGEGAARLSSSGDSNAGFTMSLNPNPNNGLFTIDLEGALVKTIVEIRSLQGELVGSYDLRDTDMMSVDLRHLAPGVYLVNAMNNGNRSAQVERLIIR